MSFSHSVEELVAASTDDRHTTACWWKRVLLGDVCDIINGYPFESKFFNGQHGVPLIRIRDVTNGVSETKYSGSIPAGYWVERGDLIVGMDGDFNTRIWNSDRGLLNQRVCKLIPREEYVSLEFISYLLPGYLDLINKHTHSITVKHLSSKTIQEIPLPLPSRREQERIVVKLDSLFARNRAARDELARIPLLIEHYKQAILEKAFSGELTADWRKRRESPSPHVVNVGSLVSDIRYGTSRKCLAEAVGVAVLRIPNVSAGRVDLTDLKYTELSEREIAKLALRDGDILVVRSNGSADLVGRPALVTTAEEGLSYAGYLIRLRPNASVVLPEFLKLMLESPQIRQVVEINARSTSGVHNINSEELAALQVPRPELDEQKEIVRRIQSAMEWLNVVATEQGKAEQLLDHLDQGLLAKAFRGELVPQDPSDEPAEMLLERIRAARGAQPKARRGRRARTVEGANA